jgi:2'-5' RNA ligase
MLKYLTHQEPRKHFFMNNLLHTDYQQWQEYWLVLSMEKRLTSRIRSLQQAFAAEFSLPQSVRHTPYIYLSRFVQAADNELQIVTRLEQLITAAAPFRLRFTGFGGFPSHTIFLAMAENRSMQELVAALRKLRPLLRSDVMPDPFFTNLPHCALATKLDWNQYQAAVGHFSGQRFADTGKASEILLLKKTFNDPQAPFRQVATMLLSEEKKAVMRQGSLF